MRIRSVSLISVFAAFLLVATSPLGAAASTPIDFEGAKSARPSSTTAPTHPSRVIVKYKGDSFAAASVEDKHDLAKKETLDSDTAVYEVPEGSDPKSVAKKLEKSKNVEFAEPDYLVSTNAITNDSLANTLWGLQNTGQSIQGSVGTTGMDVNASPAWSNATGNGVIVGVMDEGVDIEHPDLASRIWMNTADCFSDGVDHDGNGYANDCHGWDFYHDDNTVFDAADGDDHGTHVAGTIAAVANNNLGVAGVAPSATIMPLKFLGPGGGASSDAIKAIAYAKAHGVKIINCSWGGSGYSQALRDAMANSGILFLAATGNEGHNISVNPHYPASFDIPNVIAVAAINNKGSLADFSGYSGTTSVGAPGVDIMSTMPKKGDAAVAIENRNASNTWQTTFWGFGLEAVSGATNRRDALKSALDRMGATSTTPILLVDDDESVSGSTQTPDTRSYYATALSDGGYTNVSVTDVPRNTSGPSDSSMSGKIVIWQTGYAVGTDVHNTLTASDLVNLESFVVNGGKLLIAGGDAIWRNEDQSFVTDTLGVQRVEENDYRTTAVGSGGTTYNGLSISLSGSESPFGTRNIYQDTAAPNGAFARTVLYLPAEADYNNAYAYKTGTSMATPHVAGVAALALQANPAASATDLASYIKTGVKSVSSLSGKASSGGIVNAAQVVANADGTAGSGSGTGDNTFNNNESPAGYRFVASDGGIFSYGSIGFYGSAGGQTLSAPIVGMAAKSDGTGYWLAGADGSVLGFGNVKSYGSLAGTPLNKPIVGIAATPSGNGYWLVATDGGIFSFGDAAFHGSTGAITLNKPIVGMASTISGNGYWLVASDGGIFSFGDAAFFGSAGSLKLNQPIVGMSNTSSGNGYWLVAADGGIFSYGDAAFYGSAGSLKLNKPIVGMSR